MRYHLSVVVATCAIFLSAHCSASGERTAPNVKSLVHLETSCSVVASADRLLESLDQITDTLRQDDGRPYYVFRFPDAYGDDLRNQRFRSPRAGFIRAVLFAFPTVSGEAWSTGDPDLVVKLWPMGQDSLPVAGQEWISDTVHHGEYGVSLFDLDSTWRGSADQFAIVDLSHYAIRVDSGQWFHAGYTIARNSDDDSLAILSDDGSPPTGYASEWYNGEFVLMREGWGGVNFFIRVVFETETASSDKGVPISPASVVLHPVYPNPFNSRTRVVVDVPRAQRIKLRVYDMLGRERLTVVNGLLPAGSYTYAVDFNNLPSGQYTVLLAAPDSRQAAPAILVK